MNWFAIVDDDVPIVSINRWGPNGWKFITACAFAYPQQPSAADQANMITFLMSMQHVLPCPSCKSHYAKQLLTLTADSVKSQQNLLVWINTVRNAINRVQGKPEVSYNDMLRVSLTGTTESVRFRITKKKVRVVLLVAILVILILMIGRYYLAFHS